MRCFRSRRRSEFILPSSDEGRRRRYAGTAPGARIGRGIVAGVPDLFALFCGLAHMVEIKTRLANYQTRSNR
jgi:hypothetical protein